jgi:inorganic pyrophosphatase
VARRPRKKLSAGLDLAPFDPQTKGLNAVIDTPKGSRNKFKFDDELGLFRLSGILPAGAVFPFDFGDVPSTRGEDGDPLDVLVLMDGRLSWDAWWRAAWWA